MLLLAVLLLLAAVGLLAAAIYTGQTVLAWASVGLSALVVLALLALLRRARRRHRDAADADPDAALDVEHDDRNDVSQQEVSQQELARAEVDPDDAEQASPPLHGPSSQALADTEPDEEDTDAADLLVVWELSDEVLVVDEHPRYHLARCSWPDAAATEALPVQEARELGFTPCAQCRPDATLARKRRAALAKQDPGREPDRESDRSATSGGQDSDNSAVLG